MVTYKKKQGRSKFWVVFTILVALTLALIAAGLVYLWQVMIMYEQSTPDYAMQNLEDIFKQEQYGVLAQNAQIIDNPYEPNEIRQEVYGHSVGGGELKIGRLATGNTSTLQNYQVKAGEDIIGGFKLAFVDEGMFGHWQIEQPVIAPEMWGEVTVRAPATAQLAFNGVNAQQDVIAQTDIPYEILARLPESVEQPMQTEYRLTDLMREPTINVTDDQGEQLAVALLDSSPWHTEAQSDEARGVSQYYGSVALPQPQEDLEALQAMAFNDAENYSRYLSDDNSFSQIATRLLPRSNIYYEMSAMETMFYTPHTRVSFTDEVASNFVQYSEDIFSVDIKYTYTVYRGENRPYVFDTNIALVYVRYGDNWRVGDIKILS